MGALLSAHSVDLVGLTTAVKRHTECLSSTRTVLTCYSLIFPLNTLTQKHCGSDKFSTPITICHCLALDAAPQGENYTSSLERPHANSADSGMKHTEYWKDQ